MTMTCPNCGHSLGAGAEGSVTDQDVGLLAEAIGVPSMESVRGLLRVGGPVRRPPEWLHSAAPEHLGAWIEDQVVIGDEGRVVVTRYERGLLGFDTVVERDGRDARDGGLPLYLPGEARGDDRSFLELFVGYLRMVDARG